jgi:ubiquinone/menaquinone biosynthesis C-methylase UbiE/protein tyrosine phosphatase (PTP) superfamily phosphohydrolase (DUF442 family)
MKISATLLFLLSCIMAAAQQTTPSVEDASLGTARNVHAIGNLYTSGQFGKDDIAAFKERKIRRVISLRTAGEVKWDEAAAVKAAAIKFDSIPFGSADTLNDSVFDQVRRLLRRRGKVLLHCGSANRVGAVWLTYRVLDQGVPLKAALTEAKTIGLRTPGFQTKAVDYITRTLAKTGGMLSVKPGINDPFDGPDLDIPGFLKKFEVESREIYSQRRDILAACELKPGYHIADVGAGTGLFTNAMARAVGKTGWVYAVDIAPKFLDRINKLAVKEKLTNVGSVLCSPTSVTLPTGSIDLAFVCDTYHHFEYPSLNLASLHRALKPGGRLIIIDFERIIGKTRPWILGHVRANKETFTQEIVGAGFSLKKEVKVKGLKENYFLIFER